MKAVLLGLSGDGERAGDWPRTKYPNASIEILSRRSYFFWWSRTFAGRPAGDPVK